MVFLPLITQSTVKNHPVGVDAHIDPFPKLDFLIIKYMEEPDYESFQV